MGRTGVCLRKLDESTVSSLLECAINILCKREFVDVLLPWVSSIVRLCIKDLSPGFMSDLVECLLALLSEPETSSQRKVEKILRAEILKICNDLESRINQ